MQYTNNKDQRKNKVNFSIRAVVIRRLNKKRLSSSIKAAVIYTYKDQRIKGGKFFNESFGKYKD
jgi:hypothetical protein